jgi:hypothetical protein
MSPLDALAQFDNYPDAGRQVKLPVCFPDLSNNEDTVSLVIIFEVFHPLLCWLGGLGCFRLVFFVFSALCPGLVEPNDTNRPELQLYP